MLGRGPARGRGESAGARDSHHAAHIRSRSLEDRNEALVMARPSVLVVGDSISNHWMESLPAALGSAASCTGGSDWSGTDWSKGDGTGCDSTQALAYVVATLRDDSATPDILLLNCGLHDIKRSVVDGRYQVGPERYRENLDAIVAHIRSVSTTLVWVSTTPVVTGPDGTTRTAPSTAYANASFERTNETVDWYNKIAASLMRQHDVPILPLHDFSAEAFADIAQGGTYDSVHFTPICRRQQAAYVASWLSENGFVRGLGQLPRPADLPAATTPAVVASGLLDAASGLGEETPAKYQQCPAFSLFQWWEHPAQRPRQRGRVRIGVNATALCVYVWMEDSDIISYSTTDNQKMWQLGDCVELFLKAGQSVSDYWEIHVTPNGHLMDMHIQQRETLVWEEAVAAQSGAQHRVAVGPHSWAVELCVPFSAFGLAGPPPSGAHNISLPQP